MRDCRSSSRLGHPVHRFYIRLRGVKTGSGDIMFGDGGEDGPTEVSG